MMRATSTLRVAALAHLAAMFAAGSAGAAGFAGLQAWVGKYPFDRVGGKTLLDHPGVRPAIQKLLGPQYRAWSAIRGPSPPVLRVGDYIAANYCQAHDCGDKNTTILAHAARDYLVVCWTDMPSQAGARWFIPGQPVRHERGQSCPGDENEVRAAIRRHGL
jgi:hypothetical protein